MTNTTPSQCILLRFITQDFHKTCDEYITECSKTITFLFLTALKLFRPLLTLHFLLLTLHCYSRYKFQASAIFIKWQISHYTTCFQIKYLEYDYYSNWQDLKPRNNCVGQLFDLYRYSRYIAKYHQAREFPSNLCQCVGIFYS